MYRNQHTKHVVLLHLLAQYGLEAILHHIYGMAGAKWRIHVYPRFRERQVLRMTEGRVEVHLVNVQRPWHCRRVEPDKGSQRLVFETEGSCA